MIMDIRELATAIKNHGGLALLVGGTVRDMQLCKQDNRDWDIEVHGMQADDLLSCLEKIGPVKTVGKAFAVYKMKMDWGDIDISSPRRDIKTGTGHKQFDIVVDPHMGISDAAKRRDFTINSMALDPITNTLYDHHGGMDDLQGGFLRPTSNAFGEDPLRVLRGMQFAGRFGLTATPEFLSAASKLLVEKDTLSTERIWIEWEKWANGMIPSCGINVLRHTGWLPKEIEGMSCVEQDPKWHKEGDVLTHTLLTVDAAAKINTSDRVVLVLAALLHDVGKAQCTETSPSGRIIAPGHDSIGAEIANRILSEEVYAPLEVTRKVCGLIRNHMFLVGRQLPLSPRSVKRLSVQLAEDGLTIKDWSQLAYADRTGRLGKLKVVDIWATVEGARQLECENAKPVPVLMGRHLIGLGWNPGPHFGPVLAEVYEHQLDGKIIDLQDAYDYLDDIQ